MTVINKYIWLTTRVHSISFFLSPLGFFFIHLTHKHTKTYKISFKQYTTHNTHTHTLTYFRFLISDSVISGMTFRCVLNSHETLKWVLLHYNFSSFFRNGSLTVQKFFFTIYYCYYYRGTLCRRSRRRQYIFCFNVCCCYCRC